MRTLSFQGALTSDPAALKQYFLLYDCLLPLEWRVKAYYSDALRGALPMLTRYFDRVSICDNLFDLSDAGKSFYVNNARALNIFISENVMRNARNALGYSFGGIDEVLIPVEEFAANRDPIIFGLQALHTATPIRRIDLILPHKKHPVDPDGVAYLERWSDGRGIQFNVVTEYDSPEEEWYSRPNIEELVDPDPIPYREGELWCSITADSLYHLDGFHLNRQRFPDDSAFYQGIDPLDLVAKLAASKVALYAEYAAHIMNRADNIYFTYFNWVAQNVKVNENFTFVPNFMLRPDTKYYKALVDDGLMVPVPPGLLKKGATQAVPIVEIAG